MRRYLLLLRTMYYVSVWSLEYGVLMFAKCVPHLRASSRHRRRISVLVPTFSLSDGGRRSLRLDFDPGFHDRTDADLTTKDSTE